MFGDEGDEEDVEEDSEGVVVARGGLERSSSRTFPDGGVSKKH